MKKSLTISLISTFLLLLIPLVAMQFTEEVKWSSLDFLIAAILIFSASTLIQTIVNKIENTSHRIAILIMMILTFLAIWAELAVGIFD